MSRQIQIRRGTAAEHNDFTGAIGEITMDTTNNSLRVHDGSTVGGHNILNETKITEKLSEKVNKDATNFTNTGKSNIANMSMPSSNITSLSIGASGTKYTAPADGYFWLRLAIDSGGFVQISISGLDLAWTMPSQRQFSYTIPVSKGSVLDLVYSNRTPSNFEFLAFVYANGAQ